MASVRVWNSQSGRLAERAPWPKGMTPACDQAVNPDLWFPMNDREMSAAQEICAECPIKAKCLEIALTRKETGVWGGVLMERGRPRSTTVIKRKDSKTIQTRPKAS